MATGMIWWSTPSATVGLIVKDDIIVDCPPYARRWALGHNAEEIWTQGMNRGVRLQWVESGCTPPPGRATVGA